LLSGGKTFEALAEEPLFKGYERGSDGWVGELEKWVTTNPKPKELVESSGHLMAIGMDDTIFQTCVRAGRNDAKKRQSQPA